MLRPNLHKVLLDYFGTVFWCGGTVSEGKILKKRGGGNLAPRDPKKESLCRQLISIIEGSGIEVRREELKRGHGWQAVSGVCEVEEKAIMFLDRRLTQDDQIAFLIDKIMGFGITPEPEKLSELPRNIQLSLMRTGDRIADLQQQ